MNLNPQIASLQEIVNNYVRNVDSLTILEAGCGSSTKIDFPSDTKIVGIDISKQQLDRNEMLSKKICGDIQTYELPEEEYDMVICWFVLEHVGEPIRALKNFEQSLKPNGLIILALPNVFSLKGLVTKFTPHFFHVAFYRYILGKKDAGKNDTVPFPTYLRFSLAPKALEKYANENGLSVDYFKTYDGKMQQKLLKKNLLFKALFALAGGLVKLLTVNKVDIKNNNFAMVLRKKAENRQAGFKVNHRYRNHTTWLEIIDPLAT